MRAGSFGEVFRGIWRGTEVAVKLLLEQDLSPDNMDDFCNEISLLSRLRHPNGACAAPCPMAACAKHCAKLAPPQFQFLSRPS